MPRFPTPFERYAEQTIFCFSADGKSFYVRGGQLIQQVPAQQESETSQAYFNAGHAPVHADVRSALSALAHPADQNINDLLKHLDAPFKQALREHFQACASAQVWPQRLCLQVSYEELTYFIANGRILTGGQVQDGYALAEDALWELGYMVLPATIQDRALEAWRNNHPEGDDPAQLVLGLLSDDPQYLQKAISMLTG